MRWPRGLQGGLTVKRDGFSRSVSRRYNVGVTSVHAPHVFGGTHGTSRPLSGQDAPIPSGAQFAFDDQEFHIQPMSVIKECDFV